MKKLFVFLVMFWMLGLVACGPSSQQIREQELNNSGPATYHIQNFVERQNINNRQTLFDNPAQVSWIYCLADNGQVVFYGDVLGKVTSSGKRLEPSSGGTQGSNGTIYGDIWTDELIQQDGTFGHSDEYVYWFDNAGNYYQWGGNYFLTSVPISVNESVLNIRNVAP